MTKKKLNQFIGKDVKINLKNKMVLEGTLWRYYRTELLKDNDYLYYIGFDGSIMTEIKPSEICDLKEI